jgi:hypothetical protein
MILAVVVLAVFSTVLTLAVLDLYQRLSDVESVSVEDLASEVIEMVRKDRSDYSTEGLGRSDVRVTD